MIGVVTRIEDASRRGQTGCFASQNEVDIEVAELVVEVDIAAN